MVFPSTNWLTGSGLIRALSRSMLDGTIFRVGLLDSGQIRSKKRSRSTPRVNHS